MSVLQVSGPVHVYAGVNVGPGYDPLSSSGSVTPLYLGTAEIAVFITIDTFLTPIPGSIGGVCPIDYMFDGEEATIRVDLNRWNEAVYRQCAARPDAKNGTRGTMGAKDTGRLRIGGGYAYPLYLQFPYSTKQINIDNNMRAGYRFVAAWLAGPDGIIPGTRANKRTCIFKAVRVRNDTTGAWTLYDAAMTNVPAVPPVGATGASSSSS